MVIQLAIVIGIFIVCIYSIHKYYDWYNPYVDEIVCKERYTRSYEGECYSETNDYVAVKYKRTYKNGKIEYIIRYEK